MTETVSFVDERTQLFKDLFSGKTPQRVPITNPASIEFSVQYAGKDIAETLRDPTKLEDVLDKVCQDFFSDIVPLGGVRFPSYYQMLGSRPIVMSSSGYMQHPEVEGMIPEEYDEFISSPYDCILEKVLPRLYTELDTQPNQKAIVLAKAMKAYNDDFAVINIIREKMKRKYGYASMVSSQSEAPFDFLADFLRGFKGITLDIRRYPEKVTEACKAILPLLVKKGTIANCNSVGFVFMPLHMAPYLREKDFIKFYWPTFKEIVETLVAQGHTVNLFVENDWMRYLDYLYDLPENTVMRFEYGDPQKVKEKLGKKHILSGFYPATLLQTGTTAQCIDKVKETIDILAPGGKYWFNLDKPLLPSGESETVAKNLKAVLHYVYKNGSY